MISAATAAATLALLAAPHGIAAGPVSAQIRAPRPAATTIASSIATVGDATAQVSAGGAQLYDGEVVQRWHFSPQDEVTTVQFEDPAIGRDWAVASAPDFQLTLNAVATSSEQVWHLLSAKAQQIPYNPARPAAGPGVQIVFRYGITPGNGLIELVRTWSLYPGDSVENVSEELINHTPLIFRIGLYSLVQLSSDAHVSALIETYHGGADWRQDFRVTTDYPGAFNAEGELARYDDGAGEGWVEVSQRRSGVMSRVVKDPDGRTWVGVDNARDLFDFGPILTSPPDYNRLNNPLYPVPLRGRTLLGDDTLDLGQAFLGVYHGGAQQAAAAFVDDFAEHVMATSRTTVDLNSFHPWEHGSGMSAANLEPQAKIFAQLGGEVFMLDDQWQGKSSGDWEWDTQRYPMGTDGVPKFVTYIHSLGLKLGLWMSPAEFNPGSSTYKQHPLWACTPTGDVTAQIQDDSGLGVWNMNLPVVRQHLTEVVDRLISQDGVREFKFDYVVWLDCPPFNYLDYEDAYVGWVEQQQALHPGVTFELDETNDQRLWPFRSVALGPSWFDNGHLQGSSYPSRLLHDVYDAAPWIPPSDLGFGLYDGDLVKPYTANYLMPIALLGHITFWTDLTKLTPQQLRQTAWWIKWYKANRAGLAGLVYEDSNVDPVNGTASAAFQPWDGSSGYLFAFRQDGPAGQTVPLQGLGLSTSYVLTNVRTGKVFGTYTGATLEAGLVLTLPSDYSAEVFSIEPATGHARKRARGNYTPAQRALAADSRTQR